MANQKYLAILKQGVQTWNQWRKEHVNTKPDLTRAKLSGAKLSEAHLSGANLSGADLFGADLSGADLYQANLSGAHLCGAIYGSGASFSGANLSGADLFEADLSGANLFEVNLSGADLSEADLSGANLSGANLSNADLFGADLSNANLEKTNLSNTTLIRAYLEFANLSEANLTRADLSGANLSGANLSEANLSGANLTRADLFGANLTRASLFGANLSGANLSEAVLVETYLTGATLTECSIYGISVWKVQLEGAKQDNLVITPSGEPTITVDNLEVAQFIYLLLNNPKIRDVIDTIAKKAVLILGRFTPERKAILDALREALRTHGYLPILFDFDKPSSQDLTETVTTLAHLSRFIIADLTDPSCIPYELHAVIPNRMVPVLPLLKEAVDPTTGKPIHEFAMFRDLRQKYHWVLPTYRYRELEDLLASLQAKVIAPAEQKAQELEEKR